MVFHRSRPITEAGAVKRFYARAARVINGLTLLLPL